MTVVKFAPSFLKHVDVPNMDVEASSVSVALEQVFDLHPGLRGYVLDDQGAVRHHVTVFVNDTAIEDRASLSDRLADEDHIFVFQALSGG